MSFCRRSSASSASCSRASSARCSGSGLVQRLELEDPRLRCSRTCRSLGRRSASRRPRALRIVRATLRLAGDAGDRLPGAPGLAGLGLPQGALHHVRQLEVLEEDFEELVARQHEGEVVLGLAVGRAPPAAPAGARRRLVDAVAGAEGLVAGQHVLAQAALGRMVEGRLANPVGRHRDVAAAVDVGDAALAHRLVDGVLDVGADPPDEAAAVAEALLLRVQPAVDEVRHRGPVTLPC